MLSADCQSSCKLCITKERSYNCCMAAARCVKHYWELVTRCPHKVTQYPADTKQLRFVQSCFSQMSQTSHTSLLQTLGQQEGESTQTHTLTHSHSHKHTERLQKHLVIFKKVASSQRITVIQTEAALHGFYSEVTRTTQIPAITSLWACYGQRRSIP